MVRRTFKGLAALAMAGAVSATSAAAQEAAPAPAAPAAQEKPKQEGGVEEIIVTSRLREESIQDVPLAVQQFGQQAIEQIAPSTLRDFDGLAPNVFIGMNTAGPGASAIYIRGLGYADIEKTQTPNVGVVIDGVFVPSSTGQLIDTFDIEAIEVNRGPQAILWGRNTSGGTIVVRRGQPKLGEWDAKLLTTYGNYVGGRGDGGAFKVQGVVNVPLTEETLALRLGYTFKDEQGYSINERTGENRGAVDYQAINAKLLFQPTEKLSLLFNWDWIEDRSDIPPQDPRFDGDDPYVNRSDRQPKELAPYDVSVVSLEANYELPWNLKLTSITAYWNSRDLVYQDFDGGFADPLNPATNDLNILFARLHTRREQDYDVFSQEIRFQGSVLDDALNYTFGFYYARDDHDHTQRTEQIFQGPPALMNFLIPAVFTDPTNCTSFGGAGPTFNGPVSPTLGQFCTLPVTPSYQFTSLVNKSWALFGSFEYAIPWVEGLKANFGVRYIKETKEFNTQFGSITNGTLVGSTFGAPAVDLDQGNCPTCKDSWDDVVFEAGANYQVLENLMVYYRFAQGFRSGGFSLRASQPIPICNLATPGCTRADAGSWSASFDPENTDSHEFGVKSTWLDSRLVANFATFYNRVEGGQGSSIISGVSRVGTNTLILNGGYAKIYGVEFQGMLEVIEGLNFDFTLGWQKAGKNFSSQNTHNLPNAAGGTVCSTLIGVTSISEAGCPSFTYHNQELARVPELTWAVGLTERIGVGPGEVVASARYRHNDDFWIIPPSIPDQLGVVTNTSVRQNGYSLLDVNVSYEFDWMEHKVRAGFVGKNLTDKQYKEQELPLGAGGFRGWGPPRYVGGELMFEL